MSEPAPAEPPRTQLEVRVGSATNALQPIPGASRSLAAGGVQWLELALVAVAAASADQLTKALVSGRLALGDDVDVLGPFTIHHVRNTGIAFGLFSTWAGAVTFLTAGAVLWMVFYFARAGARHPVLPVALGLLIGGSAGNLVDRVRLGHVTDFIDLEYWPAFNLADTFIVTGVAVLMIALIAAERRPRVHGSAARARG